MESFAGRRDSCSFVCDCQWVVEFKLIQFKQPVFEQFEFLCVKQLFELFEVKQFV
jgi:hypothetical protein